MKKIMEEGLVIIVLLALASCGFQPEVTTKESSAQESSSQVETENLQNDVATEVSRKNPGLRNDFQAGVSFCCQLC